VGVDFPKGKYKIILEFFGPRREERSCWHGPFNPQVEGGAASSKAKEKNWSKPSLQ
jgi:hypothetical protein